MEDSKKLRVKNEQKDQRRRRQGRQPAGPVERTPEKQTDAVKEQKKSAYGSPDPEFYNNLIRESDEILKIAEESNTKYKKKDIQSNWAKYEKPVESYKEIDKQRQKYVGADYKKLIQAPVSAGGHFQFNHEKSRDTNTGPTISFL